MNLEMIKEFNKKYRKNGRVPVSPDDRDTYGVIRYSL